MALNTWCLGVVVVLVAAAAAPAWAASLVIFTYTGNANSSLDGPYDWAAEFAATQGISASEVQVVQFNDAPALLTAADRADGSAARPYPDILFGLDNVLQQNVTSNILLPYADAPGLADLDPAVVAAVTLTGNAPMVPYDQVSISIVVDEERLAAVAPAALAVLKRANVSLADIQANAATIFPWLVLPNPVTSGAGINFLAWSIAVLGDRTLNVTGAHPGQPDWRPFWRALVANGALVRPSWGEAFEVFATGSRPIVFSYATNKAYDVCNNLPTTYFSVFSTDGGVTRAWKSIEGVAITRWANATAPRLALAQRFVDYTLNTTFQGNLSLNSWVFPARVNISLPPCYDAAGVYDNMTEVNPFLPPTVIKQHIATWLNEVQAILDTPRSSTATSGRVPPSVWFALVAAAAAAAAALVVG
jgi:ABC transporter substrate-binding protein (ThiB subfamily)